MALVSWHSLPIETVVEKLKTDLNTGLTREAVLLRKEEEGLNELEAEKESGLVGKALKQFKSPLVAILLLAGIATLVLGVWIDALVIFIALFINVGVGVFQEERASRAFEKLAESQKRNALVIRSGKQIVVSVADLVPGDIVRVSAGSHVPADVRLAEAKDISVNEAPLTGEWVAVEKHVGKEKPEAPLAEQFNMAWMGTLVATGSGLGVVVATGMSTQIGRIAEHLKRSDTVRTPIQRNVRKIAFFISQMVGVVVFIILALGLFRGEPVSEMLLLAIAIAVSVIPEGLPAAVTVVLAIGMEKILSRGGLVRNLASTETLGATTMILTDKTGTLTQASMEVDNVVTIDGREKDKGILLEMGVLASDAFLESGENDTEELSVHGRPMERAVVLAGFERGLVRNELIRTYPELDFLPFESERRYAASLHKKEGAKVARLHISGSPEHLLGASSSVLKEGKVVAIKESDVGFYEDVIDKVGSEGKRFMGVAIRGTQKEKISDILDEKDGVLTGLTFMGLIVFSDPIRPDVADSIKIAQEAGAKVFMLTGDGPETAGAIALEAGIVKENPRPIIGTELEGKSDDEIFQELITRKIFARVIPSQKLRVVRLLQEKGEVVAMTGDGVNDAPALRNADIGVAVGSGTEVAKEASDLVLLNDSFSIIVAAIEEGRRIMDNLKKVITHLLSTSFHEVVLIAAAVFVGAPLPVIPVQILWVNIIEEGLLNFGFAFEPAEPGVMKRDPRKERTKTILTKPVRKLILTAGTIAAFSTTAIFFLLLHFTELPIEEIRTIMFVILSLDSIFFALSLKSLHKPFWTTNLLGNKYLIFAILSSVVILILTLTLSPMRKLLSLTPLSGPDILLLVGVGLLDLFIIEISKKIVFRKAT